MSARTCRPLARVVPYQHRSCRCPRCAGTDRRHASGRDVRHRRRRVGRYSRSAAFAGSSPSRPCCCHLGSRGNYPRRSSTPAMLLVLTFVIGTGSVLGIPAYQSLVPELVPRDQIPAAAQLSSINVNLARAIGPAIAGILIVYIGVGGVFVIDAATFLFYGLVVALWRQGSDTPPRAPSGSCRHFELEGVTSATHRWSAGSCSVLRCSWCRGVLWALLPLVASSRLGLGAGGYGLLLGALGIGAVAGASVLSKVPPPVTERSYCSHGCDLRCSARCGDPGPIDGPGRDRPAPRRHGLGRNAGDGQHSASTFPPDLGQGAWFVRLPDGAFRRTGPRSTGMGADRRLVRPHGHLRPCSWDDGRNGRVGSLRPLVDTSGMDRRSAFGPTPISRPRLTLARDRSWSVRHT